MRSNVFRVATRVLESSRCEGKYPDSREDRRFRSSGTHLPAADVYPLLTRPSLCQFISLRWNLHKTIDTEKVLHSRQPSELFRRIGIAAGALIPDSDNRKPPTRDLHRCVRKYTRNVVVHVLAREFHLTE